MSNVCRTEKPQNNHPLNELVDGLEQIVANSEDDFMALGMNLQKVHMLSADQRQKIASTMQLFQEDQGNGLLNRLTGFVQVSQQETETAQRNAGQLCSNLSEMLKVLDNVDKCSSSLEKSGLLLHVIGVNTGIECSRHNQVETTFKVVAQETINLAEQIHKATDVLIDRSLQAKREQKQTLQEAHKSIAALEQVSLNTKQATDTSLQNVTELIDYSITMVNDAEQMARNIGNEISRVVMGIQFHDNLRQRIEHINQALLETLPSSSEQTSKDSCNNYLMVELQKTQLDTLIGELESLYRTQHQALGNIISEVSSLAQRLANMETRQAQTSQNEDPVADLLDSIALLQQLNSDSLQSGEKITASAQQAEQIVSQMKGAIKTTFSIANDVKINALNAIIKAAKFGNAGMSLQVLAQGMVDVSKDTRGLIDSFNQLLDKLEQLSRQDSEQPIEENYATQFDCNELQEAFQNFRDELKSRHRVCDELIENLQKEQQDLLFISRLKESLVTYAEQLDSYADSVYPEDQELLTRLRQNFGEDHQHRYTMHEERAIHQQVISGKAASHVEESNTTEDTVDLWGNAPEMSPAENDSKAAVADIDLWDDFSASETTEPPQVDLWDEPSPATSSEPLASEETEHKTIPAEQSTETQKKNDDNFGDNVELF